MYIVIGFMVFSLLFSIITLLDIVADSMRSKESYKRFCRCKWIKSMYRFYLRRYNAPKSVKLREQYKTFDDYFKAEIERKFDYERFFD